MTTTPNQIDETPRQDPEAVGEPPTPGNPRPPGKRSRLAILSFRNISAIYIFVILFVIFAIWTPDNFLSAGVWRTMLDSQAITALAALAVVIPIATGSFNLAVGAEVGFGGILVAALIAKQGLPFPAAIGLTLLSGALIGLVTGLLITRAKIDSFIATLGMSSVLLAGMAWVSGTQQILGLGERFRAITDTRILGATPPVYIVLFVACVAWYVLEKTPVGRRMYATGFNRDGARLAGVNTPRILVGSLVAGGVVAALAGVLMSSRLSAGDPTVGPSLLLPAFAAVFLGSTQFRGGRFNVWGTIVAVYVLATGIKGLQLVGAPIWITEFFTGGALLLAVGLSKYERRAARGSTGKQADRGGSALPA